jgi:hypothetical protein
MKFTSFRITGLATALAAFGLVFIVGIHAQQTASKAAPPLMTTNWIGNLVIGAKDTGDRIARGPVPNVLPNVQIGLRSDGVVIWSSTGNPK